MPNYHAVARRGPMGWLGEKRMAKEKIRRMETQKEGLGRQ